MPFTALTAVPASDAYSDAESDMDFRKSEVSFRRYALPPSINPPQYIFKLRHRQALEAIVKRYRIEKSDLSSRLSLLLLLLSLLLIYASR